MTVRNAGTETIENIVPSAITVQGTGAVSGISGPTPPRSTSPPMTCRRSRGSITPTAPAPSGGWGCGRDRAGLGTDRRTLPTSTNEHRILVPATSVDLFPTANMPFSITRGQDGVVRLTLTFRMRRPSDVGGRTARDPGPDRGRTRRRDRPRRSLRSGRALGGRGRLRGPDLARTTTGSTLALALSTPLVIRSGETATLGIRLDILATTTVDNFRVVLPDAAHVQAHDAVSGDPVTLVLQSSGGFPVLYGLGRLIEDRTVYVAGRIRRRSGHERGPVGCRSFLRVTLENQSGEGQISGGRGRGTRGAGDRPRWRRWPIPARSSSRSSSSPTVSFAVSCRSRRSSSRRSSRFPSRCPSPCPRTPRSSSWSGPTPAPTPPPRICGSSSTIPRASSPAMRRAGMTWRSRSPEARSSAASTDCRTRRVWCASSRRRCSPRIS